MVKALLIALAAGLVAYLALLGALALAGRRADARAWARFVPDCVVLVRRLSGDARIPRRRRLLLGALLAYLALPFDLVPDFLPVVGVLDDALLVALVLRGLVRAAGGAIVREHWPGPEPGLDAVLRLANAPVQAR